MYVFLESVDNVILSLNFHQKAKSKAYAKTLMFDVDDLVPHTMTKIPTCSFQTAVFSYNATKPEKIKPFFEAETLIDKSNRPSY